MAAGFSHPAARWWWLAPVMMAACFASLALIPTETLAAFFQHPLRQPMPDATVNGARLLRVLSVLAAVALVLWSLVLRRQSAPAAPQTAGDTRAAGTPWLLIGIAIAAFVLRALRISESLWYDEIAPFWEYVQHGPGPIIGNYVDPSNHIFNTLATWLSLKLFLPSFGLEPAMRLPAMVFSIATVAPLYGLGCEARSHRVGMLAATLGAVLPVIVLEGIEARGYSMMIFFSAACTWTLLAAMRTGSRPLWALYPLLVALSVWSHFVTAFVAVGHGVWLTSDILRRRSVSTSACALGGVVLGGIISLALYAPVLPDFLRLLRSQGAFEQHEQGQPGLFGIEGLHAIKQLGGSWSWWVCAVGLLLFAWGAFTAARDRQARVAMALSLLGLPLFFAAIVVADAWMYARFALFALPGAALLMAIAIDDVWRRRRAAGAALLSLMMFGSAVEVLLRPPKQPLRDAVQYVAAHRDGGRPVVAVGLRHGVIKLYAAIEEVPLEFASHGEHARLEALLQSVRPRHVIIYYPHLLDQERLDLLASRGFTRDVTFQGWADWGRGDVVVFTRNIVD